MTVFILQCELYGKLATKYSLHGYKHIFTVYLCVNQWKGRTDIVTRADPSMAVLIFMICDVHKLLLLFIMLCTSYSLVFAYHL